MLDFRRTSTGSVPYDTGLTELLIVHSMGLGTHVANMSNRQLVHDLSRLSFHMHHIRQNLALRAHMNHLCHAEAALSRESKLQASANATPAGATVWPGCCSGAHFADTRITLYKRHIM